MMCVNLFLDFKISMIFKEKSPYCLKHQILTGSLLFRLPSACMQITRESYSHVDFDWEDCVRTGTQHFLQTPDACATLPQTVL